MPRGRQYYDPIVMAPGKVQATDSLERIELFPDQDGRWVARHVLSDGRLSGDPVVATFDHDQALALAQERWPGLTVYELRNESEDSTWDGIGPSPRLWQGSSPGDTDGLSRQPPPQGPLPEDSVALFPGPGDDQLPPAVEPINVFGQQLGHTLGRGLVDHDPDVREAASVSIRAIMATEPGSYVLINDIITLLLSWADQFDDEKNPSAALGLREAAESLKEIG